MPTSKIESVAGRAGAAVLHPRPDAKEHHECDDVQDERDGQGKQLGAEDVQAARALREQCAQRAPAVLAAEREHAEHEREHAPEEREAD